MSKRDDARWRALQRKAARRDFVYGVSTTGICCRPGCASRRPLRRHVRFFATTAAALREGYRLCKRCGPDDRMWKLARRLLALPEEGASLAALARRAGLSPAHLQRVFTRATGVSPRAFVKACRLARFRRGLRRGRVLEALADAGFGSTSRAHGVLGMSAGAYRRRGAGEEIRYAFAATPLGRVLVASTSRGVCAVSLGGTRAGLAREFPAARLRKDAGGLKTALRAVLAEIDGRPSGGGLPTDVRTTAFQARVWELLRKIPRGETRSYGELARALGRPQAARAVARAVGSNRLAVLIPCHRVVRSDGGLGGYRWGRDRKRRLLALELKGRGGR